MDSLFDAVIRATEHCWHIQEYQGLPHRFEFINTLETLIVVHQEGNHRVGAFHHTESFIWSLQTLPW